MSEAQEYAVGSDAEGEDGRPKDDFGEEGQKQVRSLNQDHIKEGLSLLCKIGNGLSHAFIKLDLKGKRLSNISAISSFVHIRFLDLSNNCLSDLSPLSSLTQLLWLKVDRNAIHSFRRQSFAQLTFLQLLSLAANLLTDLEGLVGPFLETLNLTGNRIQKVPSFESFGFANLATLELRRNKLDTTKGIILPNLRHLYLAQNLIKNLEGLEKLERLATLHLRENQIENFDGLNPDLKSLRYLNVRGNAIADEKAIQSLRFVSKTLQILVLLENPVVETLDYRINVLMIVPNLERLDKDSVTAEELAEAQDKIRDLNEEEKLKS